MRKRVFVRFGCPMLLPSARFLFALGLLWARTRGSFLCRRRRASPQAAFR